MRLRAEIVGSSTGALLVSVWTAQHVGAVTCYGVCAHKLVGSHLYRDREVADQLKDIKTEAATVHGLLIALGIIHTWGRVDGL